MKQTVITILFAAIGVTLFATSAQAVESGSSPISGGAESYLAAVAPPPGVYWLSHVVSYRATRFNDNDGRNLVGGALPADFGVRLDAVVARMHYATANQIAGGQLVWDVLIPYVDASLSSSASTTHKSGVGDVELGPGLAYHHSTNLHSAVALHVQLPTGAYDANSNLNLGHNYTSLLPIYTLSYVNPTGVNGDLKVTTSFNTINRATQYKSGSEVVVDYALGYAVAPKWVLGVGGYVRQQFNDDTGPSAAANGNRARVFAVGPSFIYNNAQGFFITAKYQQESKAQNTWQGRALWLKAAIPF